ncbi:hypothetical protein V6R21_24785 [Limibacter armeniacum]|uniref:McrB family protein n=1 Tax=Limibacter armeniacum TaxID=466084 RepID=UPI002FE54E8B
MIYIRNIFKQDLRDGKQIAFTKAISNVFFNFDYQKPDEDRQIEFSFKEQKSGLHYSNKNGEVIKTRLYAERSESRIDGELKSFLRETLDAQIDDILLFKKKKEDSYEFEFFPQASPEYQYLKDILKKGNHEIVVNEGKTDESESDSSVSVSDDDFDISSFQLACKESGLLFEPLLIKRFVSSLLTKPFVLLTGLSGSGKTKLAQSFVQWITKDDSQYCIVPVGADWTNREPLLGYPNALNSDEYVRPDNGALDILVKASKNPELPYFLILDEMNLSHVERYFADFLSVMESKDGISLHSKESDIQGIPSSITLPPNLFIIGTVNIDETTYMFSPKVLDRANTIEFRVTEKEIENFFNNQQEISLSKLKSEGVSMVTSFLKLSMNRRFNNQDLSDTYKVFVDFFGELKKVGAEFGYRTASEMILLINQLTVVDTKLKESEKIDIAVMQKLLPKLHGSRRKLCPVLEILASFCVDRKVITDVEKDIFNAESFDENKKGIMYPISLNKIYRMYRGAIDNGFASYAEA